MTKYNKRYFDINPQIKKPKQENKLKKIIAIVGVLGVLGTTVYAVSNAKKNDSAFKKHCENIRNQIDGGGHPFISINEITLCPKGTFPVDNNNNE